MRDHRQCRQLVLDSCAVDVNVSTLAPKFRDPHFPSIEATCPHGVTYYIEPTTDQRVAWAEAGVP